MVVYLGFDTETTPFEEGISPDLKLWCVYGEVYTIKKKKNFFTGRYRKEKIIRQYKEHGFDSYSFQLLLQDIINQIKKTKEHFVLSAFNLPFDFFEVMPDLKNLKNVYSDGIVENTFQSPSFIIIPVIISKRKDKFVFKKLYIIDLGNYTGKQWNLKGIAKAFNLPKKLHEELDIDFNTLPRDYEITNDIIDYCYRDAEIVFKAMKIIDPAKYRRVKVSASSMAFTELQKLSGWRPFDRPTWVVDAERSAYFGGRVEVNPMFRGKQIEAIKYDVNSMYPSVMYDMKVPTKYLTKMTRANGGYTDLDVIDLLEYIYESDDLQANVKCDIKMLKNCLPYRDEKNILRFSAKNKYISGFWTIEEIFPAIRDLEIKIEKVSAIYLYEAQRGLFNKFVNHYYDIKANAKNPIDKFMSKLMLNGSYGKFGQRYVKEIDLYDELQPEIITLMEESMINKTFTDFISKNKEGELVNYQLRKVGNVIRSSVKTDDESPFKATIIASLIGSLSRRKLWEVMKKVEWAYVDTDSITIPKYFLNSVDINDIIELDDKKLGAWSIEQCCKYDCQTFTFWNKKDYRCLNAYKLKGVPKHVITSDKYDKGIFEDYDRIIKPKEATIRKLPPYSIVKGRKQFKR